MSINDAKVVSVNTVNVFEIPDKNTLAIQDLVSFIDDTAGNKLAEEYFRKLVGKYLDSKEDTELIEEALDNGYYEFNNIYIGIVHSTKTVKAEVYFTAEGVARFVSYENGGFTTIRDATDEEVELYANPRDVKAQNYKDKKRMSN